MWKWLRDNNEPLQGMGAAITAVAALAALIVIPWQINAADDITRAQTAREIYREFVGLTVQKPELANANFCTIKDDNTKTAYAAYMEYMLYTAEQVMDTSPDDWRDPMAGYLQDHMPFLCAFPQWDAHAESVVDIITELRLGCAEVTSCAVAN
jgi:hypothetical protein